MQITQTLKSGLIVRQDFRDSVRFIMFETGVDGWQYATHGGTAFVVYYERRYWGITCKHVLGDFSWAQIALTDTKFGKNIAGLKSVYYPSDPTGGAVDSDILDVAVIEFSVEQQFFQDRAYVIDPNTVGTAQAGDHLQVNGLLKDKTQIEGENIVPIFALLNYVDNGPSRFDPVLRKASATFRNYEFNRLTGFSGAPVFNRSARRLSGVVVRAGCDPATGKSTIWYIDVFDVIQILQGITKGRLRTSYSKSIKQPVPP